MMKDNLAFCDNVDALLNTSGVEHRPDPTLTFVVRTLAMLQSPNTAGTGRWSPMKVSGEKCYIGGN